MSSNPSGIHIQNKSVCDFSISSKSRSDVCTRSVCAEQYARDDYISISHIDLI